MLTGMCEVTSWATAHRSHFLLAVSAELNEPAVQGEPGFSEIRHDRLVGTIEPEAVARACRPLEPVPSGRPHIDDHNLTLTIFSAGDRVDPCFHKFEGLLSGNGPQVGAGGGGHADKDRQRGCK